MKMTRQEKTMGGWYIIPLFSKLFGFSIIIPRLVFHFLNIMHQKWKRRNLISKVVMITGASSGLGEALAHIFYSCGCKVILVARRKNELERVKNDLMKYKIVPIHPPIILTLDLTDINNIKDEVLKVIMIHGRIDILINNAGISYRGKVIDTNVDVDVKIMLTNYFSQVALSKIVLPFMIEQKSGHIVGISSVQGRIAIPFRSSYAASKHALQAWYDCSRAELTHNNIKFTVVNPGYIKTSLSINALKEDGKLYGLMDETTKNGYEPEYVAECILNSVLQQKKEVTIAPLSMKVAMLLRTLFPSFYFWIMQNRARKLE